VEKTQTAHFQVSEAFGKDLKEVLVAEGINPTDIVLREQQVVDPRKVIDLVKHADLVGTTAKSVNANAGLVGAAFKAAKATATVVSIGTAIAGIATCNVM
jgi:hypothetical protein